MMSESGDGIDTRVDEHGREYYVEIATGKSAWIKSELQHPKRHSHITEKIDPKTNVKYFVNNVTGTTAWTLDEAHGATNANPMLAAKQKKEALAEKTTKAASVATDTNTNAGMLVAVIGPVGSGKLSQMMHAHADQRAKETVTVSMSSVTRESFIGCSTLGKDKQSVFQRGIFTKAFGEGLTIMFEGLHEAPDRVLHEIEAALESKTLRLEGSEAIRCSENFAVYATATREGVEQPFVRNCLSRCQEQRDSLREVTLPAPSAVAVHVQALLCERYSVQGQAQRIAKEMTTAHLWLVENCKNVNLHDLHRWILIVRSWPKAEEQEEEDIVVVLGTSAWLAYHARLSGMEGGKIWREGLEPTVAKIATTTTTANEGRRTMVTRLWGGEKKAEKAEKAEKEGKWEKEEREEKEEGEQGGQECGELFDQALLTKSLHLLSKDPLCLHHPSFKTTLQQLLCALASGLPVLLVGAVGSGKTTAVKAAAKLLQRGGGGGGGCRGI